MRVAIIENSVVTSVVLLDATMVIDTDGKAARGPATYTVEGANGSETVTYEAVYSAPDGAVLVASDTAGVGWTYQGGVFSAPSAPALDKAALATYAAAKRYAVETGGITVNGQAIRTDRESQALINGAYNLSLVAPGTIQFKTETSFIALSADDIKAIAIAVGQHVQAAFAKEADVAAAINAGTITDTAGIDTAFASVQ